MADSLSLETVIDVKGLETRFGAHVVHENLDFSVRRGEVIAIIGGSGTGKTTLMREIILLQQPTAGSIKVFGREVLGLSDQQTLWLRRLCGVMFQNGALFNSLTVAENVAVSLHEHAHLSPKLVREIANYKIALSGLPANAADKYPSELSGGMIKRAALARSLALDPEILFLDEPTAGLDPIGAGALDDLVLSLKELMGLTVVIVTHDLDSLWRVTDRVAVLADRRVLATDTMQNLAQMEHPWLKEYLHGPRGRAATAG
ncbi:MAG: ATP-binding cassette domain-containing protein [Pseudomonadota bacterium]